MRWKASSDIDNNILWKTPVTQYDKKGYGFNQYIVHKSFLSKILKNGNMVIESLICEVCTIRCHYDMYIFKIIHLQCVTHSCDSKCEICTVTQGFLIY